MSEADPKRTRSGPIDAARLLELLGRGGSRVPLTRPEMARSLSVAFYPDRSCSPAVQLFARRLREALERLGAVTAGLDDALARGGGRLPEGWVVVAGGPLQDGDLPIDHVRSLRTVTVVGLFDGPCPALQETAAQDRLDRLVETLAWNITQVAIFVEPDRWTLTTMNGALETFPGRAFEEQVARTLVPKLAAPVVPPRSADLEVDAGGLDVTEESVAIGVADVARSAPRWAETGLLLFHTPLSRLRFRSRRYARIARAYLDERSGMSYGFLARQLPTRVEPARPGRNGGPPGERDLVPVHVLGRDLWVRVPAIRMLATRSGCDKSNVDASRDLVLLELKEGRLRMVTPDAGPGVDQKPSYDALTIVAHGLGNVLVAAVLESLRPGSSAATALRENGAGLAHWHGEVDAERLPAGYGVHGADNPPVSCSTVQSAVFSVRGKLSAMERQLVDGSDPVGDLHVEPLHGVNLSGHDLTSLARLTRALDSDAGRSPASVARGRAATGARSVGRPG